MKRLFTFLIILAALFTFSVSALAADITEDAEVVNEEKSVFDALYSVVCNNASEILCALSVIATGALALAYKRGLLPLISKSLSAIVGTVGKMKDATEGEASMLKGEAERLSRLLDGATEVIGGVSERLSRLEAGLEAIGKLEMDESAIKIILLQQVDTLADIFMNSAMPEYRKSELAEKLKVMKEELENVCTNPKPGEA